jgi:hypothetical protein
LWESELPGPANELLAAMTSDNSGTYVAPALTRGIYIVRVEAKGFKTEDPEKCLELMIHGWI